MQGESICGKCNMQLMSKINNFVPMFGLTFKYMLIVGKLLKINKLWLELNLVTFGLLHFHSTISYYYKKPFIIH